MIGGGGKGRWTAVNGGSRLRWDEVNEGQEDDRDSIIGRTMRQQTSLGRRGYHARLSLRRGASIRRAASGFRQYFATAKAPTADIVDITKKPDARYLVRSRAGRIF
jgi:hypothetical protein